MKDLFWALCVIAGFSFLHLNNPVYAETEKTKVCVDVKDKEGKPVKDAKGNVKQTCKEMKVHKKLEGTEVPVKK
jgi:hypothetical protein